MVVFVYMFLNFRSFGMDYFCIAMA